MARTPWGPRRLVVNGTSIFLGLGRRNRFSLILMTDIVWLRMYVREGEPQYSPGGDFSLLLLLPPLFSLGLFNK
jgi:hypothetical protein